MTAVEPCDVWKKENKPKMKEDEEEHERRRQQEGRMASNGFVGNFDNES